MILPFVLFGCETWSVTLRQEHRLMVFENRVLREICEAKNRVLREICEAKNRVLR